ncbi:hypothetical protein [Actinacidiphila glaucinigra]|uniref:hypothetical protein n=1 Tax=Actinacidiphila glaucinigra TaxID=235986 RepID=UPI0036E89C5F
MALLRTSGKRGSSAPLPPSNGVFLWACVLVLICAAITVLVMLGMPVAAAVTTISSLALVATQVVNTHHSKTKDDAASQPGVAKRPNVAPEEIHSAPRKLEETDGEPSHGQA